MTDHNQSGLRLYIPEVGARVRYSDYYFQHSCCAQPHDRDRRGTVLEVRHFTEDGNTRLESFEWDGISDVRIEWDDGLTPWPISILQVAPADDVEAGEKA